MAVDDNPDLSNVKNRRYSQGSCLRSDANYMYVEAEEIWRHSADRQQAYGSTSSSRGSLELTERKGLATLVRHNQLSHKKSGVTGYAGGDIWESVMPCFDQEDTT